MKTELVRIRCMPTEKTAWEEAAGHKGFSRWARALLNEAARKNTEQQRRLIDFDQDDEAPA